MLKWFRKSTREPLAVSMSGVKLGDRLLVVGCGDLPLLASLAAKVGLTGRACALDEHAERSAEASRFSEAEGALVEAAAAPLGTWPYETDAFDLVILRDVLPPATPDVRVRMAAEARRVLRPGGRCMVIDTAARGGLSAVVRRNVDPYGGAEGATRILEAQGFVAVRRLAEQEGLTFVEGVKKGT